jgi:hypothetical protein
VVTDALVVAPPSPAPIPSRTRWIRLGVLVGAINLAFASPVLGALAQRPPASTERALTRLVVGAFGGLSLPIVAAAVAATIFAAGAPIRARLDRLVAAGAAPSRVIARPVVLAIVVAALSAGVVAGLIDLVLRARLGLAHGSLVALDTLGSAWAVSLGAAAWSALAIPTVARGGKGARAFLLVGVDLASRLLPGGAAWLAPSAHVENVLGAPPSARAVPVPVIPQLASVVVLLVIAVAGAVVTTRSYDGAPAKK